MCFMTLLDFLYNTIPNDLTKGILSFQNSENLDT